MFDLKLRLGLAVLAMGVLLTQPPAQVEAIEAKGNCYVQLANGKLQGPTQLNLGSCASLAGKQSAQAQDGVGRGKWGELEIQAKADGTYQAFKDGVAGGTRFWDVEELINYMVDDIDGFWQRTFEAQGWNYRSPNRVQAYTTRIRTACGRAPSYNAMYCRPANSIYYDVRLLQLQFGRVGDFAPAIIVAHEWGHAIQSQRGLFRKIKSTFAVEQQADCFAGAYTRDAAARNMLEEGDVQEGLDLFGKLGGSKSHGSARQRTAAYTDGLEHGVEVCWGYIA